MPPHTAAVRSLIDAARWSATDEQAAAREWVPQVRAALVAGGWTPTP